MTSYEYKVVPAPQKGEKARGLKSAEARFAHAIERAMNDMAAQGWEYLRAETLPSEERSGLTSTANVWRNLLVFRRAREDAPQLDGRRLASAADLARGSDNPPPVSGPLRLDPATGAPVRGPHAAGNADVSVTSPEDTPAEPSGDSPAQTPGSADDAHRQPAER